MRANQYLLIGPWNHGSGMPSVIGSFDFGRENSGLSQKLGERLIRWMNHYLKEEPLEPFWKDPVHYFVMQKNEWKSAADWPVPESREISLCLDSRGHANTLRGNGRLVQGPGFGNCDAYLHDPADPVPSKPADPRLKRLEDSPELLDYTGIEEREDVLVYTSEELTEGWIVAGPVQVRLFASTTAEDVDFMCRLLDVFPDGRAVNVTEGAVRARYRNTVTPRAVRENREIREELIEPGEIVESPVFVGNTAWHFAPGHRIRLEVASSSFPRHDVNPGVRDAVGTAETFRRSVQCVYHEERYPSALILPVTEGGER